MRGPPGTFKRDSWGLRRQPSPAQPSPAQPSPAQPSPAQPSPPLPSPTPSTSTCSRRAAKAKAKARGKSPRTMAKFCQVDGSRTGLVCVVGGRVWRAWDAPLQAQHSSGSAAHRRTHPGLYRPNNTRNVVRNTLSKHQHPLNIHFPTHEPAPCCDSHQLPGQCGKQGPRVRALHRLRPRHWS